MDNRGFSDFAKVFGGIAVLILIFSLLTSPLFWFLLACAIIAGGVAFGTKYNAKKRAEKYGWNTEEYQEKYAEALEKFKAMYKAQRDLRSGMSETERRMQELADEKKAREAATKEVDEVFSAREAQMKAKEGDGTYSGSKSQNSGSKKSSAIVKSVVLPKTAGKRTKIVQKFNNQYDLYLTEEQIKRIVDASYMSNAWKREVEAMYAKYDSVYQWLHGDTAYLRAYLRAFTVQDVTSDFKMQMQIVMDSFEEVFEFSDSISSLTIDQRIQRINSKFMTNFDEITYMIAYRYLESLGLHHELDKTQLNRVDNTFDDLVAKYESMSTDDVDSDLADMGQNSSSGSI